MEWFALVIPAIAFVIGLIFYKQKLTWWELSFPFIAALLTIISVKSCVKSALITDDEYWGSMIVRARYYEYWETWVKRTCSYTTTCCCDSKGQNCQTETHYYDCSYCDHNDAYWMAYDDAGNSWEISNRYYNFLKTKWSATEGFIELNRDISNHGSCGQDGNAFDINWKGEPENSEAAVTIHTYTNRVQASHSAFKLPDISSKEAKGKRLFDYPERYDYYKQRAIIGADSLYSGQQLINIQTMFEYFNGHYGKQNKVKLFILLFYDRPFSISSDQEAYWDGGNQNELVICIGLSRATKEIQWVKPFSWTNEKRVLVDCREDIAELKVFDPVSVYQVIEKAVGKKDMHRNFKEDFYYLTIEIPGWGYWLIWILTIIVTTGMFIWGIANDMENTFGEFDIIDWFNGIIKKVKSLWSSSES